MYKAIGHILGAEVRHVDDAGAPLGHHDADIYYPDGRVASLEVTGPPAEEESRPWGAGPNR